jgi:hypothetical protein
VILLRFAIVQASTIACCEMVAVGRAARFSIHGEPHHQSSIKPFLMWILPLLIDSILLYRVPARSIVISALVCLWGMNRRVEARPFIQTGTPPHGTWSNRIVHLLVVPSSGLPLTEYLRLSALTSEI